MKPEKQELKQSVSFQYGPDHPLALPKTRYMHVRICQEAWMNFFYPYFNAAGRIVLHNIPELVNSYRDLFYNIIRVNYNTLSNSASKQA